MCIECTRIVYREKRASDNPSYHYDPEKYQRDKERGRDTRLRAKYGITLEDYSKMLEDQNGVCAICGGVDNKKTLAVDHCHDTNKIRALLCGRCNPAVGFVRTPEIAKKIAEYLEHFNNKHTEKKE